MSVLYLLVPLALLLAGAAVWAFIWAVRRGQYDDVHTPALRMLQDDEDHSHTHSGTVHGVHDDRKPSQGVESEQDEEPSENL